MDITPDRFLLWNLLSGSGIEQNELRVFNEEPGGGNRRLSLQENQAQKMSFGDITAYLRPRDTFRYVAKPGLCFKQCCRFVTLFNYSVGLREMDIFNAGLPWVWTCQPFWAFLHLGLLIP